MSPQLAALIISMGIQYGPSIVNDVKNLINTFNSDSITAEELMTQLEQLEATLMEMKLK